jgi:hypothetical protein
VRETVTLSENDSVAERAMNEIVRDCETSDVGDIVFDLGYDFELESVRADENDVVSESVKELPYVTVSVCERGEIESVMLVVTDSLAVTVRDAEKKFDREKEVVCVSVGDAVPLVGVSVNVFVTLTVSVMLRCSVLVTDGRRVSVGVVVSL